MNLKKVAQQTNSTLTKWRLQEISVAPRRSLTRLFLVHNKCKLHIVHQLRMRLLLGKIPSVIDNLQQGASDTRVKLSNHVDLHVAIDRAQETGHFQAYPVILQLRPDPGR